MGRIVLSVLLLLSFLDAKNILDIYRFEGIGAVQKIFEHTLTEQKYWENYLKDYNTTYGYYQNEKYIVLSDKEKKTLNVFYIANDKIKKVFSNNIILGKDGVKKKEGDLVTPIGVYTIVSKFQPKDTFYGPVAFALSYPNLYDKIHNRDGHGIWIHGYPMDHESRPDTTKGCLVLKNNQLEDFSKTIVPPKTYIIISEKKLKKVKKRDIAKILSFLYKWRETWAKSNIDKYLSFYSKNFKRFDGEDFNSFANMKKEIFSRKGKKIIIFKNINIIPYPNIKNEKLFRIDFHEIYKAKNYSYNGPKELYVKLTNKIKILIEK